jgi:hypothetical protein
LMRKIKPHEIVMKEVVTLVVGIFCRKWEEIWTEIYRGMELQDRVWKPGGLGRN